MFYEDALFSQFFLKQDICSFFFDFTEGQSSTKGEMKRTDIGEKRIYWWQSWNSSGGSSSAVAYGLSSESLSEILWFWSGLLFFIFKHKAIIAWLILNKITRKSEKVSISIMIVSQKVYSIQLPQQYNDLRRATFFDGKLHLSAIVCHGKQITIKSTIHKFWKNSQVLKE